MEKRKSLRGITLFLVLSIILVVNGCGKKKLNENQQQFVDSVEAAEVASDENVLNIIKDAFLQYSYLPESDKQDEKVVQAKTKLVKLFSSKIDALSQEEKTLQLDARIAEFEAIVKALPKELLESLPNYKEQIYNIRQDYKNWYHIEYIKISDVKINHLVWDTYVTATVTNTGEQNTQGVRVELVAKKENGVIYKTATWYPGESTSVWEPGESREFEYGFSDIEEKIKTVEVTVYTKTV